MADLKQSSSLPLLYIYYHLTCEDNRTWSETRTASPEELDEAEKALHKLKQIVGFCKPYDRHCHNAIGSVEDILRNVERNSEKAAMMASKFSPEPKSVKFDPRYID
jgi:hypothetical protein